MKITIKEIEIKDAGAITGLTRQLGYESTEDQTAQRIKNILNNPQHFACAAIVENEIVGWIHAFISIHLESDPFVEIGGLVVDESFRGKGIGKNLIGEVTQWARRNDFDKLRVRSNTKRNETHQFYLNLGFAITKEQKVFDKKIF
jgi:GNAT superfamily N-acetyltransferase